MTTWIGTSWKMNKTLEEARSYASGLVTSLSGRGLDTVQPFILPAATALAVVAEILTGDKRVLLGAQNGHSERREHFGETDETVRLKVAATLRHGLTPLLCIGEPGDEKDNGGSTPYILNQASRALEGLDDDQLARVLIAYEPIWAIGEYGRPATVDELKEPFAALGQEYGGRVAGLLYGGSVGLHNAAALLDIDYVDGLFVGRAAWELEGYLRLLEIAAAR
jgi:triosephosphate isomerase